MEQAIPNALERIENPILLILIAALLIAVGVLWFAKQQADKRFVEIVIENIGAIKDQTLAQSQQREQEAAMHQTLLNRFDALERRIEKNTADHEA